MQKKDELLSVIVPVYKVEKYLYRCINSITNQTYSNIEVILVDDGSPDKCGIMCDEIAQKENRVKVIHKKNGGLSSARNAGLDIASGKYITFVDSDDWIDLNIYTKCIELFSEYSCDVIDYKIIYATKEETEINNSEDARVDIVENTEILRDYLYRGQTEKSPFSVCRKIYKRSLFDGIRFPEGKVNEDIVTNFKVLSKSNRLIHISDVGYYYFQDNNESITSGQLTKKDFDLLDASEELCKLSENISDKRVMELAEIKLARSYFSLLAKAATGGKGQDITKEDMRFLTGQLRKNYKFLLKSPMPFNRKIFMTIICIDYRLLAIPYSLIKGKIRN